MFPCSSVSAYSGELGLGPNSTFLQAAVDSGSAPSLSWGLWVGRHAIPNPQDGLLVVGGYDNARVANDFSTFPSRTDCSTCLQIQNLAWVTEAGTIPLMNDTTNNFQVFLNPFSEVVQIPTASWEAFGTATNGVYDEVLGRYTYPPAGVPAGNLTFTIKDGYTTSIPASELFGYRLEYDDNGQLQIENDTYQVAWVNPYTNSDANEAKYLYTWGGPFLTMNYLVLDIEGQQFRLSEAIRQDFGSEGGVFPVKLCEGTPPPVPIDDGVNIGAIVGGVVGGVAGILIILLAAFFFYRRRKRSRCTSNQRAATASEPTSYDPQGAAMGYNPVPMTHPHGMAMYPGQPGTGYPGMGQPHHINPYPQGHASYYSDTATTTVQEMPSPENNPYEWKGSQVSSDVNASVSICPQSSSQSRPSTSTDTIADQSLIQKSLSATLTSPIEVPERRD